MAKTWAAVRYVLTKRKSVQRAVAVAVLVEAAAVVAVAVAVVAAGNSAVIPLKQITVPNEHKQ
jgi:hypothetical protein